VLLDVCGTVSYRMSIEGMGPALIQAGALSEAEFEELRQEFLRVEGDESVVCIGSRLSPRRALFEKSTARRCLTLSCTSQVQPLERVVPGSRKTTVLRSRPDSACAVDPLGGTISSYPPVNSAWKWDTSAKSTSLSPSRSKQLQSA